MFRRLRLISAALYVRWALSWIGWRVYFRRSLLAICIVHCSQFEHSGHSTMQSSQCVTVHPVPKFRSCHKAIMVITRRAHCYTLYISLTAHAVWALSWIGWRVYFRRSLLAICIAHCSQFEHSGDSTMQSSQCVTVHPVPKFRSCHKAIMVITGRAHCYTLYISLTAHAVLSTLLDWVESLF